MSKKGFIFYELMLCLMIIIILITYLVIPLISISISTKNQKLTLLMEQTLAVNVVLIERGLALESDDYYELSIQEDKLCITWWDLYHEEKTTCEKIWI